jgi:glycosyltransferase involved in cell wall biosynthesis
MIIGCMLVRNEADRWLEAVLEQMHSVCDRIVIVDDCSTDDTAAICAKYGEVFESEQSYWGTNELRQRKWMWELATKDANDDDWILCLDADETITNIQRLPRVTQLVGLDERVDGISFNMYDMWDAEHYRADGMWSVEKYWIMCVKYRSQTEYVWRQWDLHCGRFPMNACARHYSEPAMVIQHWGLSRPQDRQIKYERYMKADPDGKYGSVVQYRSILDEHPVLKKFNPEAHDGTKFS